MDEKNSSKSRMQRRKDKEKHFTMKQLTVHYINHFAGLIIIKIVNELSQPKGSAKPY